jgi:hypothetical protein
MKSYNKTLFSLLVAFICATAFAAEKPKCAKTGKNCPMNDNKDCNCIIEKCGCAKREDPGNVTSK